MKIAICGAGLVGSYTYRLLSRAAFDNITVFTSPQPPRTRCGINPCAWGTSAGFEDLIRETGLDPAPYILQAFDTLVMNGMEVKAQAMVIDKPRLITDLLKGATVLNSPLPAREFGRIIDASGISRAVLPPIDRDVFTHCVQYRVSCPETLKMGIDVSNRGYAWRFPLSGHEYHIGAGSVAAPPQRMLEQLGWLKNTSTICACTGKIRLNSPHFSLPLVEMQDNGGCSIWGVGESIGCVAPLIGEGIIPGLQSARLLLANWGSAQAYQKAIMKEFSLMKRERKVVDKVVQGQNLGWSEAMVLRDTTKRFRINLNYSQGSILLKSISRVE